MNIFKIIASLGSPEKIQIFIKMVTEIAEAIKAVEDFITGNEDEE